MAELRAIERDLDNQCQLLVEKVLSYINNGNQWTSKTHKDVTIHRRPADGFSGTLFRAECKLAAKAEDVIKYCHPLPGLPRAEWDTTFKSLEVVKDLSDDPTQKVFVIRTGTGSALLGAISPRDFIDLVILKNTPEYFGVFAHSVVTDLSPPVKNFTRGTNYPSGIIALPGEEEGTCKIEYIVQSDIGGYLPQSLVDRAVPSVISDFFVNIKKRLTTDKILK